MAMKSPVPVRALVELVLNLTMYVTPVAPCELLERATFACKVPLAVVIAKVAEWTWVVSEEVLTVMNNPVPAAGLLAALMSTRTVSPAAAPWTGIVIVRLEFESVGQHPVTCWLEVVSVTTTPLLTLLANDVPVGAVMVRKSPAPVRAPVEERLKIRA